MTVCIAALFRWNYGTQQMPNFGMAALTASDRMVTIADIEYEPPQQKSGFLAPGVVALIAGDYDVHSECFRRTANHFKGKRSANPYDVAVVYSEAIKAIHARVVENRYLAPLSLNSDTFVAQQRELHIGFIDNITRQMQDHPPPDVAALIVGLEDGQAHIFQVDARGNVSCFDDAGFAAIGLGGGHACLSLAQTRYTNALFYPNALAAVYAAKKAAETAPGVGSTTDMQLVSRDGVWPIAPEVFNQLQQLYEDYSRAREELAENAILELYKFIREEGEKMNAAAEAEKQRRKAIPRAEENPEGDSGNP